MTEQVGISILYDDESFRAGVMFYLNSMNKMMMQSQKTSQKIAADMQKVGTSTKKAAKDAEKSSAKWNKSMKRMMVTARQIMPIIGLVGASRMIQRFVQDAVKEFATFEKLLAEVFTLMPFLSESARVSMERDILALGVAHGRLTDETIPALYQAISAGVPPDNVITFIETASIAARGGVSDLRTSVDVLTTVINAYGSSVITAERAADIMFAAVQGGKVTFTELAKTAFNVIPVAASLGVEFQDVAAAIAAMTKQGVPARTATTQLRQVLINISQDGREAAEVFEQFAGKTFAEFIAEGGNMQEAMIIIQDAAISLGVTAADLFGNIRAGQGALVLTGQGAKLYAIEMDRAANSTGAMNEASETMEKTLQFNLDVAAATTEQYKILIGEGLDPLARKWAESKIFLGNWIAEMELGKKAVEEQELAWGETPHTLLQVQKRMQAVLDTIDNMSLAEQAVADTAGAFGVARDSIESMAVQIIRMSSSTKEAKQRINDATGATLAWNSVTKKYTLSLGVLGGVVIGTRREVADLLATEEDLSFEQYKNIQLTLLYTERKEAEAEATSLLTDETESLTNAVSEYFTKMLTSSDIQEEFNDLLFDLAEAGEFTIDEMIELAESTEKYSDAQLEAAKVMAKVKKEIQAQVRVMEEEGRGHYEIIDAIRKEFGEKVALAQANLDLANAQEDVNTVNEEALAILEEQITRARAAQAAQGELFSQMISAKDEVGFFTSSIEGLGEQWIVVGGRTREQNRVLGELTDQYDSADETVRDYQGGVKGLMMDEGERNDQISEQTELMGALEGKIGDLQNITGSLVSIYVPAILNQETMNEELFKSAEGSGASAFALAALGVQLGIFTEEEAEAALKAAAMASKIDQLGERIANGSISVEGAIIQMNNFSETLDEDYKIQLTAGGMQQTIDDLDQLSGKMNDVVIGAETAEADIVAAYSGIDDGISKKTGLIGADVGELESDIERFGDSIVDSSGVATDDILTHWGDLETGLSEGALAYADSMTSIDEAAASVKKTTGITYLEMAKKNQAIIAEMADESVIAFEKRMADLDDAAATALGDTVREGEGYIPQFSTLGGQLVDGIIVGAEQEGSALNAALAGIIERGLAAAEAAAETGSPSKRMIRLGRDIMFGLWLGMGRHARPVINTAETFIGLIMEEFEGMADEIQRIASELQIYALTDITEEFFDALHDQLGISRGDLEDYVDLLNDELIPAFEAWWKEIDRVMTLADAFSSAGSTFADLYTEQTLDPIQDLLDKIDDRSSDLIGELQELFDLTDEEILAQLPELLAYAESQGYSEVVDQLRELRDLQDERNLAEAEFAAEQERILELQRQQQQLQFLQAQLDLIRSLEEAGIDPSDIFEGITLGLDADIGALIDAMNGALQTLIGTVNDELEIGSPSKVFMEIGRQIMIGLGKGIFEGSQEIDVVVSDAFNRTFSTALPAISLASPVTSSPIQPASIDRTNYFYFGDTVINDRLDADLFEDRVRTIVSEEI